jgi:hypothetical protein
MVGRRKNRLNVEDVGGVGCDDVCEKRIRDFWVDVLS